jgi:hypothetical protein
MVLKTSVSYIHLTQLITQEDFLEFIRHKSSRSLCEGYVRKLTAKLLQNKNFV